MISKKKKKNRRVRRGGKKTGNKKAKTGFLILKRILFWFVFLLFVATVFWTLFLSSVMKIETIEINETGFNEDQLRTEIQRILNDSRFLFLKRDNFLLLPTKKIKEKIKNQSNLVRDVRVIREFPKTMLVEIKERESKIVWCSGEKCMIVDELGESFQEISAEKKDELSQDYVIITDISNKEIFLHEKIASEEFVWFCENLPRVISEKAGVNIKPFLRLPSSIAGEVRAETEDGWTIYFSTEKEAELQAMILKKILKKKISKSDRKKLEYIDLRLKGKVIFKIEEEKRKEVDDDSESQGDNKENEEIFDEN